MTIQDKIRENLKESMKAKDSVRTGVLRGIISSFTNESVALGRTPQDPLNDDEATTVINRAAKQRKDSIEQFEKGGRPELAESEKTELDIIQEFLPEMMSEEEIRNFVETKKTELGVTSKADFAKLIGPVMGELKGKADGAVVKQVIESVLE
jgi:uncharacterized protein YqeY